ncbi:MAG: ATP-binding protein, partial [Ruminiclostridium sp.]
MTDSTGIEPMLDMFVFETVQLIEQLEHLVLDGEKEDSLEPHIDEIFRIMHTIKGSSAMMLFNNISSLAHSIEDVFYFIRQNKPQNIDYSKLIDIILECIDFIKNEIVKIEEGRMSDGDAKEQISSINKLLSDLKGIAVGKEAVVTCDETTDIREKINPEQKNNYRAVIFFEEDCEMENIRAFTIVHKLKEVASNISHYPEGIEDTDNDTCIEEIRKEGFKLYFDCDLPIQEIKDILEETIFLREFKLDKKDNFEAIPKVVKKKIILDESEMGIVESNQRQLTPEDNNINLTKQNFISVNISKMDMLMDLVGELVISEAMVTQNPDLEGLQLENFKKSAIHLKKITGELQDIVMSMRMVSLSNTFQKMNRIIRDMCKKLNKEVELEIIGEETEVDKNIIEHISDPLMHLIRNSLDHGIEAVDERLLKKKNEVGKITLEAKNSGGDVWIIVKDDGKGLDKNKIIKKARENGLFKKPESELSDKEIYSCILLPGFSTKDNVTEFSGRGVGMDVVAKNIESIRGSVLIDSIPGEGTTVAIKIPLTLAIVDGMIIKVGDSMYTVPVTSIRESIR